MPPKTKNKPKQSSDKTSLVKQIVLLIMAVPQVLSALPLYWGALLCFLLGGLLVFCYAPFYHFALLFLLFPCFFFLIRHRQWGAAFFYGWAFAFGQFLFGWYWLGSAILIEGDKFLWVLPLAIIGLPAGMALIPAAAMAGFGLFSNSSPQGRVLSFVFFWSLGEFLRGNLFGGFPWNLLGQTAFAYLPLAQSAALWGIYGLSVMIAFIIMGPIWAGLASSFLRKSLCGAAYLVFCIALIGGGFYRLLEHPKGEASYIGLRLIQPAISQRDKWNPNLRAHHIEKIMSLSQKEFSLKTTQNYIIWPEVALPLFIQDTPHLSRRIADSLPQNTSLLMGALRYRSSGGGRELLNSLILLEPSGQVKTIYDKNHLVPFGEVLPLQALWARIGLKPLAAALSPFTKGVTPPLYKPLNAPPFSVLICYEAIFPNEIRRHERSDWIINVTNDAWFGKTIGPYQHFSHARMRTIEQGLPMIRVANTGISAIIDPLGRVLHETPLQKKQAIEAKLPQKIDAPPYLRFGNLCFFSLLALIGILAPVRKKHA
ncbi:MAG: apolipoprotein N-acyltransferase [Parvibaculales bacterium]